MVSARLKTERLRGHRHRISAPLVSGGALVALSLAACDAFAPSDPGFADLPRWTVEPERELGTVDGEVTFGTVLSAAEGPDGVLHVLEWDRAAIRRFGPQGQPLPPLGRSGSGPGEFNRPSRMGWDRDGLWVTDQAASRITWFGEGDEVLRTLAGQPVIPEDGDAGFRVGVPLGDGTLTANQVAPMSQIHVGGLTHVRILRINEDMEILDTLAVRRVAGQSVRVTEDASQGGMFSVHPFPTASIAEVLTGRRDAPSGLVLVEWAWEPEPLLHVTRRSLEGDTVFHTSLPFQPAPVTDEMTRRHVERIAEAYAAGREVTPERARRVVRESLEVPAHLRPVDRVVPGPEGTLWLRLAHPEGYSRMDRAPPTTGDRWLVLEADGTPGRLVQLPPAWSLQWVGREHVWAVRTDELEVNYLVRARLVEAVES